MIKYIRFGLTGGPSIISIYPKIRRMNKKRDEYDLKTRFELSQKLIREVNDSSFHCEFIISGRENILPEQAIYYCNHISNFDPIALLSVMPRPVCFLAKKEVIDFPVIGTIAHFIGSRFIDREDLRSELKVFREIDQDLEKFPELSYIVFPEGTRSKRPDFELLPFHAGSFKLAERRELPIVPICMYLTDRVLYQRYHYKKYPIQISFLDPIRSDEYENMTSQEIADRCHDLIYTELQRLKKQDYEFVKSLNHYSDKKMKRVQLIA